MTYEEVAEKLRAHVCWGCDRGEGRRPHRDGWVDVDGLIHWAPREVRRPGLYRFLKLVARAKQGTHWKAQGWGVWLESSMAYDLGLEIGVRLSRDYAATDRALVRSWLVNFGDRIDTETRRKIERWARN